MVIKVRDDGTVFENSPMKTHADVRHEFVPEISVASQILNQPETVDRFRKVTLKIKHEDRRIISAREKADNKRDIPTPSPDNIERASEDSVKRFRVDEYADSLALLSDHDGPKLLRYDAINMPSPETSQPESCWRRWGRTVFFCCW